jgi:hypothetical protein
MLAASLPAQTCGVFVWIGQETVSYFEFLVGQLPDGDLPQ